MHEVSARPSVVPVIETRTQRATARAVAAVLAVTVLAVLVAFAWQVQHDTTTGPCPVLVVDGPDALRAASPDCQHMHYVTPTR